MDLYTLYQRHVFPTFMDLSMRGVAEYRAEALASAEGDVLEIGFGTGLNLPHYPQGVRRLTALDPLEALPGKVQARVDAAPFPVERVCLPADGGLPFEAGHFDCVAMTWTLCSIGDPGKALAEMRRVLRPGGRLLFIEHGRSEDASVARWQDRINPLHRWLACGCNLNRRIDALIQASGFDILRLDRFSLSRRLRIFSETYRGVAAPGT